MKKMIKKVTVLLLAFVLLLNICACGSEAEQKTQETEVLELEVEEQTAETENEEADQAPLGEEAKFTPEKDISFIVGFDAGGTADIPARIVAKYMSRSEERRVGKECGS